MDETGETWVLGRALVYNGRGQVEYFARFEDVLPDRPAHQSDGRYIRTTCGALRERVLCRPLDYIMTRDDIVRLHWNTFGHRRCPWLD